jgi:hypothetical protein
MRCTCARVRSRATSLDDVAGAAGRRHPNGKALEYIVPREKIAVGIGVRGIDKTLRYLYHVGGSAAEARGRKTW